jgi:O-succinylhomoserine sulfhydrylase
MTERSKVLEAAQNWRPQTQMVHGGGLRSEFGETSEAIYPTSGYVYERAEDAEARFKGEDDGFTYSRYENPTVEMFEKRMILAEGATAGLATATGMAAVSASLLCFLNQGDHIVAAKALFGSCRYVVETLCPRFGIEITLVDGESSSAWSEAVQSNTKAFFFESPSNPTLTLVDLEAVIAIAKKSNIKTIVDNVFATPVLQNPLAMGADVVVYSATKHIDGQGRCMGGMILSNDKDYIVEKLMPYLRNTGPTLSPFNAWVLLKSLETLDLRVHRHCDNTEKVADFLGNHPKVTRVFYPGRSDHPQYDLAQRQMKRGGTIVSFVLDGGKTSAFALANALQIIKISNNLGDAKSLITHPTTTTHFRLTEDARQELGITPGMLRLSVGLEDVDDLCDDLGRALQSA